MVALTFDSHLEVLEAQVVYAIDRGSDISRARSDQAETLQLLLVPTFSLHDALNV
jgi:hypothetical protein